MEKAELIATGLLFTIQLVIKATIEIGQEELRYDSPSRGRSMCRLLYLGPDLCITAFSLYLATIIVALRQATQAAAVTKPTVQVQALSQDFVVPVVAIVLCLSISQLVWFLVPKKEFPLSQSGAQPTEAEYWYCDWPRTPKRITILLSAGFLLGCGALATVTLVMRHTS